MTAEPHDPSPPTASELPTAQALLPSLGASQEEIALLQGATDPPTDVNGVTAIARVAWEIMERSGASPVVRNYLQKVTVSGTALRPPWLRTIEYQFQEQSSAVLHHLAAAGHSVSPDVAMAHLRALALLLGVRLFVGAQKFATERAG